MAVRVELRRDAGKFGPALGCWWVRRRQIARVLGPPDPQAIAELVDHRGRSLGFGLYSPESGIVLRMLSFDAKPPTDWLERRLSAALTARARLGLRGNSDVGTSGYREINSEGDALPGLVVDRFGEHRVVQITTAPMAARREAILAALGADESLGPPPAGTFVIGPETAATKDGFEPFFEFRSRDQQDAPTELEWRECGRRFAAPAPPAQKTGAYHDQRDNRESFAALLDGRGPVLDLGTHVGGFAIAAAARGSEVVAVDQSAAVLACAAQNAARNGVAARIEFVAADMFAPLDDPRLAGPFAGIVFDPPKIASSRRDLGRALGALTRTLAQLQSRIVPQGLLAVCSCSHHLGADELDRAMLDASRATISGRTIHWTRIAHWGAGPDHPIQPGHAEGEYLRVRVYQSR